ncbi:MULTISPECIES: hypothetical protein [unclassified Actinobaculum]|uniref:hypothetical protein n=1 Tax=unclassified Actinobaculum TaxID=2609299 RepID=UPI000F747B92|nr:MULTISPECIES: hypothetical protein [unclassified Actinobaculum]RTE50654.1 hypothetical protein EKN07_00430 [Actinobaculum sp. 352]
MQEADETRAYVAVTMDDFVQCAYLLEKIHRIVHRAQRRRDPDNRAYALAITFAEEGIEEMLNAQRMKLYSYLTDAENEAFEELCASMDRPLPDDEPHAALREKLRPYLWHQVDPEKPGA